MMEMTKMQYLRSWKYIGSAPLCSSMNSYSSLSTQTHTQKDKAADLLANTSRNLDIIYHLTRRPQIHPWGF